MKIFKQTILLFIFILIFSNIFLTAFASDLTYLNGIQRKTNLYNTLKLFNQIDTVKSIILVNGQHISYFDYDDLNYHKINYKFDKNYISNNLKNNLNYDNLITQLDLLFFEKNPEKADLKTIMMSNSEKKMMINTPVYAVIDYVYVNNIPFSVVIKFKPFESTYFLETKSVPIGDYGVAYPYSIVEMSLVAGKVISAESSQLLNLYFFDIMKAFNSKYSYNALDYKDSILIRNRNNDYYDFQISSLFNEYSSCNVMYFVKDTHIGIIKYSDLLDYDARYKNKIEKIRQNIIKEQYSQKNQGFSDYFYKI